MRRHRRARPYTQAEHEALIDWPDIIKHKQYATTIMQIYDHMPAPVRRLARENTRVIRDFYEDPDYFMRSHKLI